MDKKKIVVIGPAYPYRGGQALVEAYLHKTLTDMNYDTFTVSYKMLYPKIFFPGKTQYDESKTIPFEHNDKIFRILNSINPISWIKAFCKIKKEKADAVIIVWWMFFFAPCLSVLAWLIKHFSKQTHICFLTENYISHENHWFEKFLVKHTLKYAQSFIAESRYIYEEIRRDFPQTTVYQTTLSVYDCYDLKRYDKTTARDFLNIKTKNVILFFGLIRPYKGLDKLINAFPELLKSEPDTTLMIIGECYEDINKYKQLINQNNIGDNVMMDNRFIANEDVEPYFKAADMVVMPYNSGTQSGILMMAYGFRVPVVVTDVGGITELVKPNETGIIIENNSAEKLIPAIKQILQTKDTINYSENIENFINNLGYGNLGKIVQNMVKI